MKKEDLTTRLLRNLFHIQGPFDECRQEIIYKACARSMVQIVYSSFFLFLFYLLFGRFIEAVRYTMPYVYSGLIFFITLKTQRVVKRNSIWKKMTSHENHPQNLQQSPNQISKLGCVYRPSDWPLYPTHLS